MGLRRILLKCVLVGLVAGAYIASPFVSAWNLREAIKRNDPAAIEARVEWPRVRDSLRASLSANAALFPAASAAGEQIQPSMWQRIKGAFGATMLDRFIETYVTPEGLPKLFDYRRMWRETVANDLSESDVGTRMERVQRFWARIKRAEFQTLTRVEIEMEDNKSPDRRFVSVMELDGMGWKLTSLRVIAVDPAKRLAELEAKQTR